MRPQDAPEGALSPAAAVQTYAPKASLGTGTARFQLPQFWCLCACNLN